MAALNIFLCYDFVNDYGERIGKYILILARIEHSTAKLRLVCVCPRIWQESENSYQATRNNCSRTTLLFIFIHVDGSECRGGASVKIILSILLCVQKGVHNEALCLDTLHSNNEDRH